MPSQNKDLTGVIGARVLYCGFPLAFIEKMYYSKNSGAPVLNRSPEYF
jgi:hypothetical protein